MNEPSSPEWPRTWYIVARSSDIGIGGIHDVRLGKRDCVIFRTEAGVLAAIDAHCPHIGANLRRGNVIGDAIRCPLHGWLIGADGMVASEFATCVRSNTWPVAEQHGLVFLHLGKPPEVPAPSPENAEALHWSASTCFDLPPRIEPDQRSVRDHLMNWLAGDGVPMQVHCHANIFTAAGQLRFGPTAAIFGVLPWKGGLRAFGAFGVLPGPFLTLRQWLARSVYTAYLDRRLPALLRDRTPA